MFVIRLLCDGLNTAGTLSATFLRGLAASGTEESTSSSADSERSHDTAELTQSERTSWVVKGVGPKLNHGEVK